MKENNKLHTGFRYKVFKDQSYITIIYEDDLTYEKAVSVAETIQNDEEYSPDLNGILDLRHVKTNLSVPLDSMKLALWVRKNKLTMGSWVVIVNNPVIISFALIYESVIGDDHVATHARSLDEASHKMGIKVEPFINETRKNHIIPLITNS